MHSDLRIGQEVSRRLWLAACQNGGPVPLQAGAWKHIPGAFQPAWLASLALSIDGRPGSNQTVALVKGDDFDRSAIGADVAIAYSNNPRTQVYESVGARSGGWFAAVDTLLARLFRCEVTSDVYVSNVGDANIGLHRDEWYGIIIQLYGAKQWTLLDPKGVPTVIMLEAGDVLLLPPDVRHNVSTPHHSMHVVFAVMTHEPLLGS